MSPENRPSGNYKKHDHECETKASPESNKDILIHKSSHHGNHLASVSQARSIIVYVTHSASV